MNIEFSKGFTKQYDKADKKIQRTVQKRITLFRQNPQSPQLRIHQLTGKLKNYYSINITGDWSALYTVRKQGKLTIIIFELLGTHSQLYK